MMADQLRYFPCNNLPTFVLQHNHLLNVSFHSHLPTHCFRAEKANVNGRPYLKGQAASSYAPLSARKKYRCSRKQMSVFIRQQVQAA
jgi:hypothetical protein